MPHCSQCGTAVDSDDIYCPKCGHELDERFTAAGEDAPEREEPPSAPPQEPASESDATSSEEPNQNDSPQSWRDVEIADDPVVDRSDEEGDGQNVTQEPEQERNPVTDSRMSRRKQLAILGGGILVVGGGVGAMTVLGGGGQPQHQLIGSDTSWDSDRYEEPGQTVITGSITLPKGRFAWRSLSPRTTVEVVLDVEVDNGPIDVLTMDDAEYERYREREKRPEYRTGLSETKTDGTRLEAAVTDSYKIIFDNTGVYGATPSGDARIDFSLTASL